MINKFTILSGAKYFSLEIFQNYLVFIPTKKYIKYFNGTTRIESWKSNGMSEESIENITKAESNLAPIFDHQLLSDINLNRHCLTLGNCLSGSVKLTKNGDLDKYKYTGYCIGFDSRSEFLFTDGSYEKMSLYLDLI